MDLRTQVESIGEGIMVAVQRLAAQLVGAPLSAPVRGSGRGCIRRLDMERSRLIA